MKKVLLFVLLGFLIGSNAHGLTKTELLSLIADEYENEGIPFIVGTELTTGATVYQINVADISEDSISGGGGRTLTFYVMNEGELGEKAWSQKDIRSRQKTIFYKQVEDWLISQKVKYNPSQLQVNEAGQFAMGFGAYDIDGDSKLDWCRFVCHKDSGSVEIEWINP